MYIVNRVVEAIREITDILKWPIILGLFFLEGLIVLGSVGILLQITYTLHYNLIVGYFMGALAWSALNSPLLYYLWRRIKEEDSQAKIMMEGWEGSENITKAVQNYEELLAKQRNKHKK